MLPFSLIRYSPELQNSRSVIYYLPPSYNENTLKPYSNLLVMHDGQNLFDPKTSAFGTAWMGDLYLDWIESTLIPLTVKTFPRFSVEHDYLGILGSSLGGLISCYAGVTRPNVYGRVGCMSTSLWWAGQDFQINLLPSPAAVVNGRQVFDYLHSEKDFSVVPEEDANLFFMLDQGGKHNEASWGKRFHLPIESLYPAITI
eukprot:gene23246-31572_t